MNMNYAGFVAKTGQVNTPPGSYDTVRNWVSQAMIRERSRVLEVGCSTGFISYQIHAYTGATVHGIDISEEAIRKAQKNCTGVQGITFSVNDAGQLPFEDNSFSHVVIGGHLPFAPAEMRRDHVKEAMRVLATNGFLLTALYYYFTPPDMELIAGMRQKLDLQLKGAEDYGYWSSLFDLEGLVVESEKHFMVHPPDEARRQEYLSHFSGEQREEWEKRVELFARNAEFVRFFVRVMSKQDPESPYTQTPKGGIYTWEQIPKQ
jgi:SAM-dependent methyltransferase